MDTIKNTVPKSHCVKIFSLPLYTVKAQELFVEMVNAHTHEMGILKSAQHEKKKDQVLTDNMRFTLRNVHTCLLPISSS